MLNEATRAAIVTLAEQGVAVREISRLMKVSRNAVRRALRGARPVAGARSEMIDEALGATLRALYTRCGGNVVRVQELLRTEYQRELAYSSPALSRCRESSAPLLKQPRG